MLQSLGFSSRPYFDTPQLIRLEGIKTSKFDVHALRCTWDSPTEPLSHNFKVVLQHKLLEMLKDTKWDLLLAAAACLWLCET